jgi:hypothetical protein
MTDNILRPSKKKKISVLPVVLGAFLGIVFWRGAWNLLDRYFMPDNYLMSNLVCVFVPIILATLAALAAGYKFSWNKIMSYLT